MHSIWYQRVGAPRPKPQPGRVNHAETEPPSPFKLQYVSGTPLNSTFNVQPSWASFNLMLPHGKPEAMNLLLDVINVTNREGQLRTSAS